MSTKPQHQERLKTAFSTIFRTKCIRSVSGPMSAFSASAPPRPFLSLASLASLKPSHLYSKIMSGVRSLSTRQNRSERTESMSDRSTYARHFALHLSDICILATTIRGQQYTLSRTDRTTCIAWNSLNRPCIEPYG